MILTVYRYRCFRCAYTWYSEWNGTHTCCGKDMDKTGPVLYPLTQRGE